MNTSEHLAIGYGELGADHILRTIRRLRDRIEERFPGSGLGKVSADLARLGVVVQDHVAFIGRPHWPIRIGASLVILAIAGVLLAAMLTVRLPQQLTALGEVLQIVELAVNDVIFLGAAVWFLVTRENALKRSRALTLLHQLRSIAHIVDMHQLTKDPEHLMTPVPATSSSPQRAMGPAELGRYLDYCSEMLSLISKLAALLVQRFNDPVVLAAVDEIEGLVLGLSGKIWQKISLLERVTSRSS